MTSLSESELEGYIRRHEADAFAHGPMRHEPAIGIEARLLALERWQQRFIGALAVVTLGVGVIGGLLAYRIAA